MNPQNQLLGMIDQFIPEAFRRYPDGHAKAGQLRTKQFFTYSAPFVGGFILGPGGGAAGVQTIPTSIQRDSDFLILNINRIVTDAANTTFFAACPATILLTTTGTGQQLMDQAVPIDSIAGTAQLPGTLPYPIFLPASSTLQTTLTNLDTVNTFAVRVTFPGVKIF